MLQLSGKYIYKRFMSLLVRQNFSEDCEKAINAQIALELKASHEYLAMAYHFDRCDVASPSTFTFFQKASTEERQHAETLMKYMNKRGGSIVLGSIPAPTSKYCSILDAMKKALEMEKTVNESLLSLHKLASDSNDPSLCDLIETQFLQEQVDAQKGLADYIKQIERCENDLGNIIFDRHIVNSTSYH